VFFCFFFILTKKIRAHTVRNSLIIISHNDIIITWMELFFL